MKNPIRTFLPNFRTRLLPTRALNMALLWTAAFPWNSAAQIFNSGSDGSYGPMNITGTTNLVVPPNGIFNCTSINIAGGTLTFTKNALNTPVYLLATSTVDISGIIDLSGGVTPGNGIPGRGGPGGFDGGEGGFTLGGGGIGGDGAGPGGGSHFTASDAVYGQPVGANTNVYGNVLLSPLIGGSGGAGLNQTSSAISGPGGGGGGGALLIAANNYIAFHGGVVFCRGAGGGGGAGSGGAIRIVAPVVTGTGDVETSGGSNSDALGRIRIDCVDSYSYRTIGYNSGVVTRGSQMFVFPPVIPTLSILQAAGQTIPEGTNNSVVVNLPASSSTNQTVTVQGRGFTNDVNIVVSVVPANGASSNYLATITRTNNPSQITVNVIIRSGTSSSIYAWTH